jgi:hypothetical protein
MRIIIACLASAVLTLATGVPAAADFKVQMPDAETGEIAVEPLGDYGHDPNHAHSGELSTTQEFEYGVNAFWRGSRTIVQIQSGHFRKYLPVHRTRPVLAGCRLFCRVRQVNAPG